MGKTSKINLVGKTFGILTVMFENPLRNKNGHITYRVKCKCGKEKDVLGSSLRYGKTKSCRNCYLLHGKHGMWNTREFRIWVSLKHRCNNSDSKAYKYYGGKGIKVAKSWNDSFLNFYNDMGPSNGLSIDRIDVNGNYCKENCRWATPTTQARNRTNNKVFTYKKETKCAAEWCEIFKIPTSTFYNRINRGWNIIKTLETPINKNNLTNVKDNE